ncbi:MAG: hypothetical protein ACLR7U_05955 [Ruthenibacterium lactatiformans]
MNVWEHGGHTQCLTRASARQRCCSVCPRHGYGSAAVVRCIQKELAIRGSFINPDTHLRAVELLSAGRINVEPLITHTFGIGEMEQAIKMQMGGESIKVMVLPNKR